MLYLKFLATTAFCTDKFAHPVQRWAVVGDLVWYMHDSGVLVGHDTGRSIMPQLLQLQRPCNGKQISTSQQYWNPRR